MIDSFLIGEKVYLRLHNETDLESWFRWFNDPEVTDTMQKGYFPNTIEKQKAFFATMYDGNKNLQLAIINKENDELVGTIGLHGIDQLNQNADLSIIIGNKNYWGQGIGKEAIKLMLHHAFNKLNLHKITAGMLANNSGSFNLFSSIGFKQEGLIRQQIFNNGQFQDVVRLGLLKNEYKK